MSSRPANGSFHPAATVRANVPDGNGCANANASAALSPAAIGRRRPSSPCAGIGAFTMLKRGRARSCRTNSTPAASGRPAFIFGMRSDSGGRVLSRSTVRTVSIPVNPAPGMSRSIG